MNSPYRIESIDRLRGIVMALMLVDHVREFFYLHQQVADPMLIAATPPALFFTRFSSHFCAPVFILLSGLGAWLYGKQAGRNCNDIARYLATRGLLLILLELSVINFAWTFRFPPSLLYLQVIWVIGLSMLALALLIWLPRTAQIALAALLICGHNALDGLHFTPDQTGFIPWSILHDRNIIEITPTLKARTSYPLLPWIGVMLAGYLLGPLYIRGQQADLRRYRLLQLAAVALAAFLLLRLGQAYGDHPWVSDGPLLQSLMSFINLTKYPPSLHFLLLTLGIGLLALAACERWSPGLIITRIGRAPLFFYVAHLYLLHLLYLVLSTGLGPTQGQRYGFSQVWQIWLTALLTLLLLYPACRWFGQLKASQRWRWLRYF